MGKVQGSRFALWCALGKEIPKEIKPKAVCLSYLKDLPKFEPFQDYTALKFAGKLSSAHERASKKVDRAFEDEACLEHDRLIFPALTVDTKNQPIWKGSMAQKLLWKALKEISDGTRAHKKPRFLFMERIEWHENYSLEFFRKKIYQEMKFDKWEAWLVKKFGPAVEKVADADEDNQ